MKNRIFWIFESTEKQQQTAFAAAPWALFGNLGQSEREALKAIWEEAYRRTQAQISDTEIPLEALTEGQTPEAADIERFKRLLEDVEAADFYGDA